MPWDPAQYLKFTDHRLRPAVDLLNRIDISNPAEVYDLGAGAGNVTRLLKTRWPNARITGVDESQEMLAKAAAGDPEIVWQRADLATWQPLRPAAVIYSNAALHWLGDHDRLFPALFSALAPGGVLAVQMPRNFSAPSHTAIGEAVRFHQFHPFDDRVRGERHGHEPPSHGLHRLVVHAIHAEVRRPEHLSQSAPRHDLDRVGGLVPRLPFLVLLVLDVGARVAGHVLEEVPSQRDVQDLDPAADGEERFARLQREADERDLEAVARGHDFEERGVRRLVEGGGIEVAAPGQEVAVQDGQDLVPGAGVELGRDRQGKAAGRLDRRQVGGIDVGPFGMLADGDGGRDADQRRTAHAPHDITGLFDPSSRLCFHTSHDA